MAEDTIERILGYGEKALEIAGFFFPGISIIPHLIKLVDYARQAEPEAVAVLNDIHTSILVAPAGPTMEQHQAIMDANAAIEARHNPQGRSGI